MTTVLDASFVDSEFERFVEINDLDFDEDGLDSEGLENVRSTKRKLKRALQKGFLVVDDRGVPTVRALHSEDAPELTFSRLQGACMLASDRTGSKANVAKMYAAIAEATGTPSHVLSKLHVRDAMLCQLVMAVFLA